MDDMQDMLAGRGFKTTKKNMAEMSTSKNRTIKLGRVLHKVVSPTM